MKKIVGILICLFMALSTISITAEQTDTPTNDLTPQPTAAQVTIEIQNTFFDPKIVIIDLPTNVTWINRDFAPHSVVSDTGEFDSHPLSYGQTYSYTFKFPGPRPYHDGLHPQITGKIIAENGGNQPPLKPTVNGPSDNISRKTTYNYTAFTLDPEQMNVSYFFDWGDNSNSGWTPFVESGAAVNASHQWSKKGSYVIRVQAKDFYANATSEWGTLSVTVPVSIDIPFYHFMERLFERFPNIFPILRHMMGY